MNRLLSFVYGVGCYGIFFGAFCYMVGFLGDFRELDRWVPRTVNAGGPATPAAAAALINVLLLAAFGVQHTIMARPGFKKWFTRVVPVQLERSTYVLLTSLLLILLYWQWRPMTGVTWSFDSGALHNILRGMFFLGFLLVLYATFLIDHFDLFGLRQVYLYLRGIEYHHPPFAMPTLYRVVRHPLYVGWLTTFWFTPHMTTGHLLFAATWTVYIFIAIRFEERDLAMFLGDDYKRYREGVPMLLPWPRKRVSG